MVLELKIKNKKEVIDMASTNKTSLGLNMWEASDKPVRMDFVNDNSIIDEEVSNLKEDLVKNNALVDEKISKLNSNLANLKDDIAPKAIEWPDQIRMSGYYTHSANALTKLATGKYLPYATDGNEGDGWVIIAIAYNTRYFGLFASQVNGTRGGFGRLDTNDISMTWIKFTS